MRNQFFRTFKDLTQVLGVATVSVGMVLNGLANINEKQNKRRSLSISVGTNTCFGFNRTVIPVLSEQVFRI